MGKVLVFEGPDASGKGVQTQLAVEAMRRDGARVARIKAPCEQCSRTYRLIYWMLRKGWAGRLPHTFQLVQFINKLVFQLVFLPRLLRDNDVVVSDRWSLSAIVYGDATGVNRTFNRLLMKLVRPADRTIVFTGRTFKRTDAESDTYDKDAELQARVSAGYLAWAQAHPQDHFIIDNGASIDEVHRTVMDVISPPCSVCKARFDEHCDAGLHS